MGKVTKIGLGAVLIVIVVVAVAFVFLLSNVDRLVQQAIEREASAATGTAVTLESVDVSLRSSSAVLRGLKVANPVGFDAPYAMELGRIVVDLDAASLGSPELVVREAVVDEAKVTFQQVGNRNNLKAILDHVETAEQAGGQAAAEDEPVLVVETFRLTGADVTLLHDRLDRPVELRLSEIVLHDVGRAASDETAASAAEQILEPLLQSTLDAAKEQAADELEERARDELDKKKEEVIESLKKRLLGDR